VVLFNYGISPKGIFNDPGERIELKTFHNEILNDHAALQTEQQHYRPIPVIREVTPVMVQSNFLQIKQDVENLVMDRLSEMMSDPVKAALIIKKPAKV